MANQIDTAAPQWQAAPRRLLAFLRDTRGEMRKVVTPSRKEVQATTTVVIVAVFFFAFYFAVVDKALSETLERLYTYLIHH
jgi:preprotein translocase subunit SecE